MSDDPFITKDHYSYRVYSRSETAREFDESKFAGDVGRIIGQREAATVRRMMGRTRPGRRILDVGVGTGRFALPMASDGARVVGLDASAQMLAQTARKTKTEHRSRIRLVVGDGHLLPLRSESFDTVLCMRVLMHVVDWRRMLSELCRVALEEVIFDVPPKSSFALLEPHVRRLFKTNEQVYKTFTLKSLRTALVRNGFEITDTSRGFVLPIAVHRKVDKAWFSVRTERALACCGLNRWFGAPLTIRAARRRSCVNCGEASSDDGSGSCV